jgi:hypothetical protein
MGVAAPFPFSNEKYVHALVTAEQSYVVSRKSVVTVMGDA